MNNTNDIYRVDKYSDKELFDILDIINPSDRELEAKILHMIWKYENFGNESGDKLARFFKDIYDHFFDTEHDTNEAVIEENITIEGFDEMENAKTDKPKEKEAKISDSKESDSRNIGYSFPLDYSKDTLNPLLKQTVKRIVSIDSQYRDNKQSLSTDFTFNLSDPLRDVVNLKLYSIQIPKTWWTINSNYGSNFFYLKGNTSGINDGNHDYKFEIPVGNYTAKELITAVNNSINNFKTDISYNDVSFGTTNISYDYPSSKATLTIDLKNRYTEPYYSTSFQYWTSPVDPSVNRSSSIPAFLGFNRQTYYHYRIYSTLSTLPFVDSSAAIIDNQASIYNLSTINNYFQIVQYIGGSCPADLSSNSVKKVFNIKLSNLVPGTTYSRTQLVNELNTQLKTSAYLTSLSGINRVDEIQQNVLGYGFSHYEMDIRLNRTTTDNSENIKTAVVFPIDPSGNGIWYGSTTAFLFENRINELSNITGETGTSQPRYLIKSEPYFYLQCVKPYYSFNLNASNVVDISQNDYKIKLLNSSDNGYTLDEYLNAINAQITTVNNKTKDSSYNINGDFKLNPIPASIDIDTNIFNLKIDLTKTFTERNYLMDLSANGKRTALSRILNIPTQNPTNAELINIDLSSNSVFNSTFPFSGQGFVIDTSYLMIIKPKPNSPNSQAPNEQVVPIANTAYFNVVDLQNALNNAFNQFTDVDGNNILQGTNVSLTLLGNNTVQSTFTVVIRKYLTQEDYRLSFVDPSASTVVINYTDYGNKWLKSNALPLEWHKVSLSSTGKYQTAIPVNGISVYTSNDYGINWVARTVVANLTWINVVVSSTGQYQTISAIFNGTYYSTDYGNTWSKSTAPNGKIFNGIDITVDGQYQTIVAGGEGKYVSNDFGATYNEVSTSILPHRNYSSVSISSNGQYQTVCVNGGGSIYYSNDSGQTWVTSDAPSSNWTNVLVSSTGQYQVACAAPGSIYYSTNYGVNWLASNAPSSDYYNITMARDIGEYQTVIKNTGILYSKNYGQTWNPSDASGSDIMQWSSVSSSYDGRYQSATAAKLDPPNRGIYYSQLPTTTGSTGQWSLTDASNSWAYNLKIGDASYNLADPSYNSNNVTYTLIKGTSQLVSSSIYVLSPTKIYFTPLSIENGGDGVYSPDNSNDTSITIPPNETGAYTLDSLIVKIGELLNLNPLTVGSTITSTRKGDFNYTILRININKTYTASDYRLVFYDPYSFINFVSVSTTLKTLRNTSWDATLGWILGFRSSTEYDLSTIIPTNGQIQIFADTVVSINIYNYFMIILDDYNQNHLNDGLVTTTQRETNFALPSYSSRATYRTDPTTGKLISSTIDVNSGNNLTQKQIYAAQEIINSINSYTTTTSQQNYSSGPFAKNVFGLIPIKIAGLANNEVYVDYGGTLQNQERTYFGPVNIHRMTVRLINDKGEVVDLNGANWSFSFICEQLYQQKKT